jgi:hypothetical protein
VPTAAVARRCSAPPFRSGPAQPGPARPGLA